MAAIVLEVTHPELEPGEIRGFRFIWAFQVSGFRPDQHCQKCFRGRRVESFCTSTARSGAPVAIERMERYPFLYVCGVGVGPKTALRSQNLHLPLQHLDGHVATATTYNGYVFTARNAVALPIPQLERGWHGLDDETTSCKNFQFAVSAFGYPFAED